MLRTTTVNLKQLQLATITPNQTVLLQYASTSQCAVADAACNENKHHIAPTGIGNPTARDAGERGHDGAVVLFL